MSTEALLAPLIRDHERANLLHSRAHELEVMQMAYARERPIQHGDFWNDAVRALHEEADKITRRWDMKGPADEHS